MAPPGVSAQRASDSEPQTEGADAAGTKRDLTTWWKQFKKNSKREEDRVQAPAPVQPVIFGVPLTESIKYANVAISLTDANGKPFTYGYVPIVVAKCGIFLKEKATDVEGIFRLAGAERRIKDLMAIFNTPDRYGKGLDWTGFTVHDAANLLRRYINSLPEPIIPLMSYETFRDPLRHHQAQAVGAMELQSETEGDFDIDATIEVYQRLVTQLPPLSRQLLLYILDLLAVFSSKSEANRMTAPNLAAIFQPGILHHPNHHQAPSEYRLSQDVLIFLIENQDHFIIGMSGTAADEKTIREVQRAPEPAGNLKSEQGPGRSTSNASAASQSARRFGDLRRNASTNSRGSRQSNQSPSPVTPPPGSPFGAGSKSSGVHRSTTLPSKKSASPALSTSERFQRYQAPESPVVINQASPTVPSPLASSTNTPISPSPGQYLPVGGQMRTSLKPASSPQRSPLLKPFLGGLRAPSQDRQISMNEHSPTEVQSSSGRESPIGTPTRERGLSSFWKQPPSDSEKRDGRRHNKLQKKRPEGITAPENHQQESQTSLGAGEQRRSPSLVPSGSSHQMMPPSDAQQSDLATRPDMSTANSFHTAREQSFPSPQAVATPTRLERDSSSATLKADPNMPEAKSPMQWVSQRQADGARTSPNSSTSTENEPTSQGEDAEGNVNAKKSPRRHRWTKSLAAGKKPENGDTSTYGSAAGAERSTSSVGSVSKQRKSFTDGESNQSTGAGALSSSEAEDRARSPRRGPLGWFKGKLQERQEKREEKDRGKSPPPEQADRAASVQSLDAVAAREPVGQSQAPSSIQEEAAAAPNARPAVLEGAGPSYAPDPATGSAAGAAEGIPDTSNVMTPRASEQATFEPRTEAATTEAR